MTRLNLPGSACAADEFQLPDGTWLPVRRAIVYDSWLLWMHALPGLPATRRRLKACHVRRIVRLGEALHQMHQRLPHYRTLDDTPFRVRCWFDPASLEPEFRTGGRCSIRIQGQDPTLLAGFWDASKGSAWVSPDNQWAEFRLRELEDSEEVAATR